jgi:hypothetical protein
MGKYLFFASLVAFYGGIGVFLIGRFLLGVIQHFKRTEDDEL